MSNKVGGDTGIKLLTKLAEEIKNKDKELEGFIISINYKKVRITLNCGNTRGCKTAIKQT